MQQITEGWYLVSEKEDNLYFNDLHFGLLNDNPINPQFAFSYQFIETDKGLIAVEVPKEKRDGKALLGKIFGRLKGN